VLNSSDTGNEVASDVARLRGAHNICHPCTPWKNSDQYKHVHYICISFDGNFISSYILNVLDLFVIK
jgi:hypothetical protein